jgi:hypothetical protein
MFRGYETTRLAIMLGTFCILGAIVFRSCNSATQKPPAEQFDRERPVAEEKKTPSPEQETAAPIDEDSEEQAAIQDAFQAVTDGTLGVGKEEMHAYVRLFDWVVKQSFDELRRRSKKNVTFDELMRTPDQFRGKLVQIDLNVRQAIRYEDDRLGTKEIYELRGFTADSRSWLYFVIAPELPDGVPVGTDVAAKVRVEGYFFKLQGYQPGSAKSNATPLKAPLIIGRVKPWGTPGEASPLGGGWLYYGAAAFLIFGMIFTALSFLGRQRARRHQAKLDACKMDRGGDWLSRETPSGEKRPPREDGEDEGDKGEEGFDFRR